MLINEGSEYKTIRALQPIEPPRTEWSVINMDFIAPLPEAKNENRNILNVVKTLSKILRVIHLPDSDDATLVAKRFIEHVYRNHGLPIRSYRIWTRHL